MAGGTLVQTSDQVTAFELAEVHACGKTALPAGREADLRLAQTLVKHLKSNAVCLVSDGMLVGAGAGQMSRVDSAQIAVHKAGNRAVNSLSPQI